MPQVLRSSHNSGTELIVWEIAESEEFFLDQLSAFVWQDKEFLASTIAHKRLELLAARYAAKMLSQELGEDFHGIMKDEHGKPYLVDCSLEMSLTHTKKYVAVAIHPNKKLGVDLEKPSSKMWRIKERLYTEEEVGAIGDDLKTMSIYWSAKEALYKLYGKRGMDFRVNMKLVKTEKNISAYIDMPDQKSSHSVFVEPFKDFLLVWVV